MTLAAVLVTALVAAAPADARSDGRNKRVLFIHGLDATGDPGANCAAYWNDMEDKFRDWGWTKPLIELSYYRFDTRCDHTINHHGSHRRHFGSGHYASGGHGANTDIRHLGYHLAWYIYSHYSRFGRVVDVVAHSMGGLMIRYALAQVRQDHPRFPRRLLVEDVVTMGTPHAGARGWTRFCPFTQCDQMDAGSGFMTWLGRNAREPDGARGTDWSVFSSADDNLVSPESGLAMGACHKVRYMASSNVEHGDFMHDRHGPTAKQTNADVRRRNCPRGWVTDRTSHWPVRRADLAAAFRSY
jgi:Putative serine esterase (DUF676)